MVLYTQPNPELVAAVVGALVGAVAGGVVAYAVSWMQVKSDRRRRRKAVASALLYELRLMNSNLRDTAVAVQPTQQAPGVLPHPMHDALLTELVLFKPETVRAVLDVYGWFRDVRHKLNQVREGVLPSTAEQDQELRRRARIGAEKVPTAYDALQREGGRLPPGQPWEVTKLDQPLLKDPFE